MPIANKKFTLNIEPVGDHLEVTIPEIGVTVATSGTTRQEAIEAGQRAFIEHQLSQRKKRASASRRQVKTRQSQAS